MQPRICVTSKFTPSLPATAGVEAGDEEGDSVWSSEAAVVIEMQRAGWKEEAAEFELRLMRRMRRRTRKNKSCLPVIAALAPNRTETASLTHPSLYLPQKLRHRSPVVVNRKRMRKTKVTGTRLVCGQGRWMREWLSTLWVVLERMEVAVAHRRSLQKT